MVCQIGLALVVDFRESGDGCLELLLLGEELVDEVALPGVLR